MLLLLGKLAVRLKDGDAEAVCILYQLVLEPAHLVPSPAGDGAVVYALGFVRNHQVLAYPHNLSQAAANGAGTQRAVETEQILVRLPEGDSVKLKPGTEVPHVIPDLIGDLIQIHVPFPHTECTLHRALEAEGHIVINNGRDLDAIYQQKEVFRVFTIHLEDIFNGKDAAAGRVEEAAVALFLEGKHVFYLILTRAPPGLGKDVYSVLLAVTEVIKHVLYAVCVDLFTAYRRIGAADAGKQEAEIIVNLSGGCNGGAGVADVHLLLYGNCRRDAVNGLHIGLYHTAKELAGIG